MNAAAPGLGYRAIGWLLTTDPKQRIRLRQTALAFAIVMVCVLGMAYAVARGFARPDLALAWAGASMGGILAAFLAIRMGWTRNLADPSLSFAQIIWSIGCCAGGYYVAGPMRGAVFPVLMVVMMFSMFRLNGAQVSALALTAVGCFGAVMTAASHFEPQHFPASVEFGHFLMLATMLPMVSVLAARLAWLRRQRTELADTLERVRELAARDALTGLANRRQMSELIEIAAASRAPFCLAIIDLDHFKDVNDRYGHSAGDEALRAFARGSLSILRSNDVLGRWGGEEFVLLQPDARLAQAHQSVERLRERIAEQDVSTSAGTFRMTLSAGVAEHRFGENGAQTLMRADAALYEAKHQGRNQVVLADY